MNKDDARGPTLSKGHVSDPVLASFLKNSQALTQSASRLCHVPSLGAGLILKAVCVCFLAPLLLLCERHCFTSLTFRNESTRYFSSYFSHEVWLSCLYSFNLSWEEHAPVLLPFQPGPQNEDLQSRTNPNCSLNQNRPVHLRTWESEKRCWLFMATEIFVVYYLI